MLYLLPTAMLAYCSAIAPRTAAMRSPAAARMQEGEVAPVMAPVVATTDGTGAPWSRKSNAQVSDDPVFVNLRALAMAQNPVVGYFDPLNLAGSDLTGEGAEATVGWIRQAEIKHGRVAMAGFVGYIVHENGIRWPWALSTSLQAADGSADYSSFDGLSAPAVWDAIPEVSKYQIVAMVGLFELWSENSLVLSRDGEKHYMRGGKPGYFPKFVGADVGSVKPSKGDFDKGPIALFPSIPHKVPFNLYDPFGFAKKLTDEQKARGRNVEINNGRLAMIGLAGFIAEACYPGSVPALAGIVKPYVGNVMQPFAAPDPDAAPLFFSLGPK